MKLRPYRRGDLPALAALFFHTVHRVNARDYTPAQLDAWAPGWVDWEAWDRSLRANVTLVAEGEDGTLLGFGDRAADGYLDRLFVQADHQGEGIGTALCQALEEALPGPIYTYASITARPFFLRRGYRVVAEHQVARRGEILRNFLMEKSP